MQDWYLTHSSVNFVVTQFGEGQAHGIGGVGLIVLPHHLPLVWGSGREGETAQKYPYYDFLGPGWGTHGLWGKRICYSKWMNYA